MAKPETVACPTRGAEAGQSCKKLPNVFEGGRAKLKGDYHPERRKASQPVK